MYCRIRRSESCGVNCQFHLLRRMWSLKMPLPGAGSFGLREQEGVVGAAQSFEQVSILDLQRLHGTNGHADLSIIFTRDEGLVVRSRCCRRCRYEVHGITPIVVGENSCLLEVAALDAGSASVLVEILVQRGRAVAIKAEILGPQPLAQFFIGPQVNERLSPPRMTKYGCNRCRA